MADDLIKNAEFGRKKNDEEPPILIAQRFLNIYRQMHIFNKDRQEQFDAMLLTMPPEVRILLSTLPGGGLLLEHIAETEFKKGVSSSFPTKRTFAKKEQNQEDTIEHKNTYSDNSKGVSGVVIDASFANELSSSLSMALQQNEKRYKEDMKTLTETLTHSIMESQTTMMELIRDILVANNANTHNIDVKDDKIFSQPKVSEVKPLNEPVAKVTVPEVKPNPQPQPKVSEVKPVNEPVAKVTMPEVKPNPQPQPKVSEVKPLNEPVAKVTMPEVKPNPQQQPKVSEVKPLNEPVAKVTVPEVKPNPFKENIANKNETNINQAPEKNKNGNFSSADILQQFKSQDNFKNKHADSIIPQKELKNIYQSELDKIRSAIENDIDKEISLEDFDQDLISLDDNDDFNNMIFEEETLNKNQEILSPADILNDTDSDEWEWEYVEDDTDSDEWEWEYVEEDADSDEWEWEYVEDDTEQKK